MPPRRLAAAVLPTLAMLVTGCGTTTAAPTSAPPPPVTVTATPVPTGRADSAAPAESTAKKLPDVVGMNLQAAQDTLQSAGFFFLDDQDATGRNRLQVYDRNWVVTRQAPTAGKRVPADTKITLYAKKHGE